MESPDDLRRALVLDDDEVMRELLPSLLETQGYIVETAASGTVALERLSRQPPFMLVLTDLQMPGLEGAALGSALRQALPTNALLLGMSATRPSQRERLLFDAFLLKPFDLDSLVEALEDAGRKTLPDDQGSSPQPEPVTATPAAGDLGPALNQEIFSSLAQSLSPSQLREIYELTLADVVTRYARILEALQGNDLATLRREAHAIKGGTGMVGATELHRLASATEVGDAPNELAIREIPKAVDRLRNSLQSALQSA